MLGIKHIALRCKDIEKSRRFYELLGMKFVGYRASGESMDLSDGGVNMTLIKYGNTIDITDNANEWRV